MERRQRIKIAPKDRTAYQQYTLTAWGDSPWPDLATPSAAECEEVYARLMAEHGDRLRPTHITAPSLEVAGCGEVPQVLDAIVRTMISANTKFELADAALQSLSGKVGVVLDKKELDPTKHPELQHCLDYNYIRTAMTQKELQEAIRKAGNQEVTAGWLLKILADVHACNKERVAAFRHETPDNPVDSARFLAADLLSTQEKQWEIKMFEHSVLNLEFLKKLSPEDAMNEMLRWKGIGVKTAACVLMFCMQQDILACDTHCIRLSKWLGWVPVDAKDELVFAHVDNMVPNHLKYALHQLFIQHGKDCILCKDNRNETKEGLEGTVCPLEDLLDRSSLRVHKAALKARIEAKNSTEVQIKSDKGDPKSNVKDEANLQVVAKNTPQRTAKSNTKRKPRAGENVWAAEKDIFEDMALSKKHSHSSASDMKVEYIPAKRTCTGTKKPAISLTTRRTRAQTRMEQEK